MTRLCTVSWHTFSDLEVEATYALASDGVPTIMQVVDGQGCDVDLSEEEVGALVIDIETNAVEGVS